MQLRKRYLLGNSEETELGALMVGCGRVQGDRNRGRIELENTLPRLELEKEKRQNLMQDLEEVLLCSVHFPVIPSSPPGPYPGAGYEHGG